VAGAFDTVEERETSAAGVFEYASSSELVPESSM
jgi:hypothetical protein